MIATPAQPGSHRPVSLEVTNPDLQFGCCPCTAGRSTDGFTNGANIAAVPFVSTSRPADNGAAATCASGIRLSTARRLKRNKFLL
ncbi:hypothetical protein [Bradyrhizobium sp. 192]|uniref:hypothetical protein n=1 Tax=Bradyrhizobium sp. 192 TaxID=2782660 RepID=UPI001FFFEEF4|nr:hypothetical protein [Bradyrhizobium sp. 192]UPJ59874.1 hypothetical protein IVB24_09180 [Bradyrhizobium sp. 192]